MSQFFWLVFLLVPFWGDKQIYSTTNGGRKTQVNKKLSTEVQEKVNKGPQPLNKKFHETLEYSLTSQVGQVGEHQNIWSHVYKYIYICKQMNHKIII